MARKQKNTSIATTPMTAHQIGNILKNSKIEDVKGGKLVVKYKTGKMKQARVLSFFIAPTWMEEEIEVAEAPPPAAKKAAPAAKKAAPAAKKAAKAAPATKKGDEKIIEAAKAVFGLFDDKSLFKLKEITAAAGLSAGHVRKAVAILVANKKLAMHGKAAATRYTLFGIEPPPQNEKKPAKKSAPAPKKAAPAAKKAATKKSTKKAATKKSTKKAKSNEEEPQVQDPRTTGTALPDPDADEQKTAPKRPGKPGTNGKAHPKAKATTETAAEAAPAQEVPPAPAPASVPPSSGGNSSDESNDWANIDWNL